MRSYLPKFKNLLLLLILPLFGLSQSNYKITLQPDGKIAGPLPQKSFSADKLTIEMNWGNEKLENYYKLLVQRAIRAKAIISALQLDAKTLAVLKNVYDIDAGDFEPIKTDLDNIINSPFYDTTKLTWMPGIYAATKYFQIAFGGSATNYPAASGANFGTISIPNQAGEADYTMGRTDPVQTKVLEWRDKTQKDFQKEISATDFANMRKSLDDFTAQVSDAKKILDMPLNNATYNATVLLPLVQAATARIKLNNDEAVKLIDYKVDKKWVLDWLWYGYAKIPALNPFPFRRAAELPLPPDTSEMPGLRKEIAFRDSFYRYFDYKNITPGKIDTIIAENTALRKKLDSLGRAYDAYLQSGQANDAAMKIFSTTFYVLSKEMLFISPANLQPLYWMRHHDASTGNQPVNGDDMDEYLETDRVVIIDHNLKAGQQASISLKFTDITSDQSRFAETVSAATEAVAAAQKKIATPVTTGGTGPRSPNVATMQPALKFSLQQLVAELSRAQQYIPCLAYLVVQANPNFDVKPQSSDDLAYHAQLVNTVKKVLGPKQAKYTLAIKDASAKSTSSAADASTAPAPVADTFSYRVNKLYRIFPMAGIAFTFKTFPDIGIAKDSSGPGQVSTQSQMHVLVGAKVYFRKTDIRSAKFFTQHDEQGRLLLLSRLNADVAIDISHPLKNLYLGLGLDPWPGICINGGLVFNRYTYNQFSGGALVQSKNLYRTSFYVGVSTDITLFADLFKLLNL